LIRTLTILLLAILANAIATAADAQQRPANQRTRANDAVVTCNERGCSDFPQAQRAAAAANASAPRRASAAIDAHGNETSTVILGGRPAGCPRQFCGCEASRYIFGKIRPELNLAANWIKYFPRTEPAPGMVAARSGHVMVLMSHVSGNDWLVHDGNSGGGLTRRHVRSIRGHVVVDPHGSRAVSKTP
jgi:hypothetical protein